MFASFKNIHPFPPPYPAAAEPAKETLEFASATSDVAPPPTSATCDVPELNIPVVASVVKLYVGAVTSPFDD